MIATNCKLLLEPYKSDGAIKQTVKSGFATTKQKSSLVGLKLMANGSLYHRNGDVQANMEKGDVVYFKEEDLHTQAWAKTIFNSEEIEGPFIIAEASLAVMVKSAN